MNFDLTKDTAHDAIALLLEIHEWAQASHPDRESEGPLEHMTSQVKLHTDLMPRAFQLVSCAKQAASIFGMQLESQRESALERVTPDRPTTSYTGEPERQSDLGSQPTNWNTSPTAEEVANFIGSQHLTPDSIQPIPATAQVEIPGDENLYYITEFLYKGPTITAAELDKWLALHAKPRFLQATGLEATHAIVTSEPLASDIAHFGLVDEPEQRFGLKLTMGPTSGDNGPLTPFTPDRVGIYLAHQCVNGAWIIAEPRSNAVAAAWLEDPAAAGLDCDKPEEATSLMTLLTCFLNEFLCKVNAVMVTSPAAESLRELGFAPLSRWIAARLDPKNQHLYLKHPFDQMRPIAGENFLHISWKAPEEAEAARPDFIVTPTAESPTNELCIPTKSTPDLLRRHRRRRQIHPDPVPGATPHRHGTHYPGSP